MLDAGNFLEALLARDVGFFTGVPDSLLKDFCGLLQDSVDPANHVIAANEGAAIALACGYHLATGKSGLVYMQNSGQGNAVNPLTSLADPEIYSMPLLMLVGWRGEPGAADEPQHRKAGAITLGLFDALGIPYRVLPSDHDGALACLDEMVCGMSSESRPHALIVRKGTFSEYRLQSRVASPYTLVREDAVKAIVDSLGPEDVVVSTTGKTSRELYEYREAIGHGHERDFLTVGSMGHASQIALGVALSQPQRDVYCIDGDGAAIMHMGSLAIIGTQGASNFKHIIINNGAHDSVGGQPTAGHRVDFLSIASACGYRSVNRAQHLDEIERGMADLRAAGGPALLEIMTRVGARDDLGRPTSTPLENKAAFTKFLRGQQVE